MKHLEHAGRITILEQEESVLGVKNRFGSRFRFHSRYITRASHVMGGVFHSLLYFSFALLLDVKKVRDDSRMNGPENWFGNG